MTFLGFPRQRPSDDEYVEQVRQGIQFWSRWRTLTLVATIAFLLAGAFIVERVVSELILGWFGQQIGAQAAMICFSLGSMVATSIVVPIIFGINRVFDVYYGFRTERLLLKYYDAFHGTQFEEPTVNRDTSKRQAMADHPDDVPSPVESVDGGPGE